MIPNMKEMFCTLTRPASVAIAALLLAGCASTGVKNPSGVGVTEMRPDERGFVSGTGTESGDIVTVTELIAREILRVPEIANAQGTPRVVLEPVENNTRFTINKDMFLDRIQGLLNRNSQGKVRFLARSNMAALERERQMKQGGQVTSTSDPNVQEFKGADFFLTGKLNSHTTRTSGGVSDYVMYSFRLIDARSSDIVYENFYEVKKQGLEDAAYR